MTIFSQSSPSGSSHHSSAFCIYSLPFKKFYISKSIECKVFCVFSANSTSPVCTRYFGALAQGKVLPVREPTPQMANPGMDLTPEILSAMHFKVMRRHTHTQTHTHTHTLSHPQITVKVNLYPLVAGWHLSLYLRCTSKI